jgi:hypothetical protein
MFDYEAVLLVLYKIQTLWKYTMRLLSTRRVSKCPEKIPWFAACVKKYVLASGSEEKLMLLLSGTKTLKLCHPMLRW